MTRRTVSGELPLAAEGETLLGIAGSHGVVIARAVVMATNRVGYPRKRISVGGAGVEWNRFVDAVCEVQNDLREMIDAIEEGRPEGSILEAYLLMVGDEILARMVHEQINKRRHCADWAVGSAIADIAGQLSEGDDPYIRERRHDIEFVGERLLRALGGVSSPSDALELTEPTVIVAHDLSPADTAAMMSAPVVAFVTESGSRTSHTSIMARALAIPAVVGVKDALEKIGTGDLLVVDGLRGRVLVEPDPVQLADAEKRRSRHLAMAEQLGLSRDRPAKTLDGVRITLHANIELPDEAQIALDHGAEGIGLYRTEYLYVSRSEPPSEDEQTEVFCRVLDQLSGRPVTLRTFDIGGDKFVSAFRLPRELNPMLGLRAVRLALSEPVVFMAHLRAMVRASAHGDVRIMIPLVSSLDELKQVRVLLELAREQVREAGQPQADSIPLGVMIEVPAAAIMAHRFAEVADFMSIGTNDLVQYALAVDRTNRALAHLASPFDPAIIRLITGVLEAGRAHSCPVSLCGEMASEVYGALLLLGLGVRDLSMESVALPEIKEAIARMNIAELEGLAEQALELSTAAEVEQLLTDALEPRVHDLITGQPDAGPGGERPLSSRGRATASEAGSD
jgi:phosphotransferase system enzyme I (PtsI)